MLMKTLKMKLRKWKLTQFGESTRGTQTRANCSPKEKNQEYREVQPDLTPDIEVFHMMFEICDTKNIKQHKKILHFPGVNFSWTTL